MNLLLLITVTIIIIIIIIINVVVVIIIIIIVIIIIIIIYLFIYYKQLCPSLLQPLTLMHVILASYSESYNKPSLLLKFASTLVNSGKFIVSPEFRAKRVIIDFSSLPILLLLLLLLLLLYLLLL